MIAETRENVTMALTFVALIIGIVVLYFSCYRKKD